MKPGSTIQNPVWKDCPPICEATMLPAFDSMQALNDYLTINGPNVPVIQKFQCKACNGFHADTTASDPGGQTSGTSRQQCQLPKEKKARSAKFQKFVKV